MCCARLHTVNPLLQACQQGVGIVEKHADSRCTKDMRGGMRHSAESRCPASRRRPLRTLQTSSRPSASTRPGPAIRFRHARHLLPHSHQTNRTPHEAPSRKHRQLQMHSFALPPLPPDSRACGQMSLGISRARGRASVRRVGLRTARSAMMQSNACAHANVLHLTLHGRLEVLLPRVCEGSVGGGPWALLP